MARRARRPVPAPIAITATTGAETGLACSMMLVAIHHDSPPAVPA
jgi:hypothetical protein